MAESAEMEQVERKEPNLYDHKCHPEPYFRLTHGLEVYGVPVEFHNLQTIELTR